VLLQLKLVRGVKGSSYFQYLLNDRQDKSVTIGPMPLDKCNKRRQAQDGCRANNARVWDRAMPIWLVSVVDSFQVMPLEIEPIAMHEMTSAAEPVGIAPTLTQIELLADLFPGSR
jgi:hypothetical protein